MNKIPTNAHSQLSNYDCAIVGGGLAGLCLSISLAQKGHSVVLFEKEQYPFHKVCGEYISLECVPYLQRLGIPVPDWQLPHLHELEISAPSGYSLIRPLLPGGIGVSRYLLDSQLAQIAKAVGVQLLENTKVTDVLCIDNRYVLQTDKGDFQSTWAVGSFGKRSNLDTRWQRSHLKPHVSRLTNYVGVKYHIQADFPTHRIALHNFNDGYCGISKIEGDRYCLCYLTTARNLQQSGSVKEMEKDILSKNPQLRKIFAESTFLYKKPLTISQINFLPKKLYENDVIMAGDAAGLITPLCGNGMSMAMQSAYILSEILSQHLSGKMNREEVYAQYSANWSKVFSTRLSTGRVIQSLFGNPFTTEILIRMLSPFPFVVKKLISLTHGKEF